MHDLEPWLLGLVATLIAAGVIGIWKLSNNVSAMSARIESWSRTFDGLMVRVDILQERQRINEERISQHGEHLRILNHIRFNEGKET